MFSKIDRDQARNVLRNAFRFHMQRFCRPYGDNRPRAVVALDKARQDVAAGKYRYPAPIRGNAMRAGHDADKPGSVYVDNPSAFGLRLVGRVMPECGGRNGYWDCRDDCGWHTDPHGFTYRDGTGLCYGLVYQLPGRKGQARFVAGYQFGEQDGVLIDFNTIYAEDMRGAWGCDQDPRNTEAARDAARSADSMAQHTAESEREYQTAWRAGSDYTQEGETIADTRKELLALLAERRAVMHNPAFADTAYFALCDAIRRQARDMLHTISEARAKRKELVNGDAPDLCFWSHDERLQSAFCEGAGLTKFPA